MVPRSLYSALAMGVTASETRKGGSQHSLKRRDTGHENQEAACRTRKHGDSTVKQESTLRCEELGFCGVEEAENCGVYSPNLVKTKHLGLPEFGS